jgi:hypothetical protein
VGLAPFEGLVDGEVGVFFEGSDVAGEVAIGEAKGFFEGKEVNLLVDDEQGHDA